MRSELAENLKTVLDNMSQEQFNKEWKEIVSKGFPKVYLKDLSFMKTKNCKVDLVADSIKQLGNWIEAIDEQFDDVTNTEIRTVDWTSQKEVGIDFDYRCSVFFSAQKSKKQIYEIMNSIKANPITFLK